MKFRGKYLLICISLCIIGLSNVAKSESFETDVGISNVKESTDVLLTEENPIVVSAVSYEINGNIDYVVPKIKHNKVGFKKVASTLATVALPALKCGCRGSPDNIYKKN
jgi:hypothetical protein